MDLLKGRSSSMSCGRHFLPVLYCSLRVVYAPTPTPPQPPQCIHFPFIFLCAAAITSLNVQVTSLCSVISQTSLSRSPLRACHRSVPGQVWPTRTKLWNQMAAFSKHLEAAILIIIFYLNIYRMCEFQMLKLHFKLQHRPGQDIILVLTPRKGVSEYLTFRRHKLQALTRVQGKTRLGNDLQAWSNYIT